MAVLSVEEHGARTYTEDENNTRTLSQGFIVVVDDFSDEPSIARDAVIKEYGRVHPQDSTMKAADFNVTPYQEPDGGFIAWLVSVNYKNTVQTRFNIGSTVARQTPLDLPDEVTWSFERQTIALEKDTIGVAVRNSAEDAFDPPLQRDDALLKVTITRNEATFVPARAAFFMNTVNSKAEKIAGYLAPTETARIINIGASTMEEDGLDFFAIIFEILFNPDTWTVSPLDAGFFKKVAGKRLPIIRNGEHTTIPALLDGSGDELPIGALPVFLDGVLPATLGPFFPYKDRDFTVLNLNRQA